MQLKRAKVVVSMDSVARLLGIPTDLVDIEFVDVNHERKILKFGLCGAGYAYRGEFGKRIQMADVPEGQEYPEQYFIYKDDSPMDTILKEACKHENMIRFRLPVQWGEEKCLDKMFIDRCSACEASITYYWPDMAKYGLVYDDTLPVWTVNDE